MIIHRNAEGEVRLENREAEKHLGLGYMRGVFVMSPICQHYGTAWVEDKMKYRIRLTYPQSAYSLSCFLLQL